MDRLNTEEIALALTTLKLPLKELLRMNPLALRLMVAVEQLRQLHPSMEGTLSEKDIVRKFPTRER